MHTAENIPQNHSIVLYFECEDLDAKVRELKALGPHFNQAPTGQVWAWRESYLHDPSGSSVCRYYAGDNRKNPPWRVK